MDCKHEVVLDSKCMQCGATASQLGLEPNPESKEANDIVAARIEEHASTAPTEQLVKSIFDAHGIVAPIQAEARQTPVDTVWEQLFCARCNVELQQVGHTTELGEQPQLVYRCPSCQQGLITNQSFPRPGYMAKKKIVVPTRNFINPNKGPRGRN